MRLVRRPRKIIAALRFALSFGLARERLQDLW
jgi:hypothetical protein